MLNSYSVDTFLSYNALQTGWGPFSTERQDLSESLKTLFSIEKASEEKRALHQESIYYPGETSLYELDKARCYENRISFKQKHGDALFNEIRFTKEGGKIAIIIRSEFTQDTTDFLTKNGISTDLGFGCQYRQVIESFTRIAEYRTNNRYVCSKLAKILFEMNQFQCDGVEKSTVDKFIKDARSFRLEQNTSVTGVDATSTIGATLTTHSAEAGPSGLTEEGHPAMTAPQLRFRKRNLSDKDSVSPHDLSAHSAFFSFRHFLKNKSEKLD